MDSTDLQPLTRPQADSAPPHTCMQGDPIATGTLPSAKRRPEVRKILDLLPWLARLTATLTNLPAVAVTSPCIVQYQAPTMRLTSIRCICLPPWCGESMTTRLPSGLKRGCVSQRHSPVYSFLDKKEPNGTRLPDATWKR